MLGDRQSKMIRAFDLFNDNFEPTHPFYGVAFPGTYIVDGNGIVLSKYFEDDHRERNTAANMVVRTFGDAGIPRTEVETPHLRLRYFASDETVYPGSIALLTVEVELKPGMHVYAPGVKGYKPIAWTSTPSAGWLARPVNYPPSHMLHIPVIDETVPVYENRFQMTRDLLVGLPEETHGIVQYGSAFHVADVFQYQACDSKICYAPQKINLDWTFTLADHDRRRAPEQFRKPPAVIK
jgi:hypothetical protein